MMLTVSNRTGGNKKIKLKGIWCCRKSSFGFSSQRKRSLHCQTHMICRIKRFRLIMLPIQPLIARKHSVPYRNHPEQTSAVTDSVTNSKDCVEIKRFRGYWFCYRRNSWGVEHVFLCENAGLKQWMLLQSQSCEEGVYSMFCCLRRFADRADQFR